MTYEKYLNSCLEFAKDTASWGYDAIRQSTNMFVTGQTQWWEETCDNAHGGLGVEWAFKLDEKTIREECPGYYAAYIIAWVRSSLDNGCDTDTIYDILDTFED